LLSVGSYYVFVQVALFYEDGSPVEGKGAGRKILNKVQEIYDSELNDVFYLAMLVDIPSTLHQSLVHTSTIFPCGKFEAEASRTDDGLVGCKSIRYILSTVVI
jgi:hypothetical protein